MKERSVGKAMWLGLLLALVVLNLVSGILVWVTGESQSLYTQVINSFLVSFLFFTMYVGEKQNENR